MFSHTQVKNTSPAKRDALVVGAGIIGMSVALELQKQGLDVTVITKDKPLETNSDVAAALWRPFDAIPEEKAVQWSADAYRGFFQIYYDYLKQKARGETTDSPGISFVVDVEFFGFAPGQTPEKPAWMKSADNLFNESKKILEADLHSEEAYVRDAAQAFLTILEEQQAKLDPLLHHFAQHPHPTRTHCYANIVPLIDTTIYRPWLMQQFESKGGKVIVDAKGVSSLEKDSDSMRDLSQRYHTILNCAGEQARFLSADAQTKPIRGLVAVTPIPVGLDHCIGIEPNPDLDGFTDGAPNIFITYAIIRPESGTCVIGGTYEENEETLSDNHKRENDINAIFDRVATLIPQIRTVQTPSMVVKEGFRCGRSKAQFGSSEMYSTVEKVDIADRPTIVGGALGHAGGGYSVSLGVAKYIASECARLNVEMHPIKGHGLSK